MAGDRVYLNGNGELHDDGDDLLSLVDVADEASLNWESDGTSTTLRTHTFSDGVTISNSED